MSSIGTPEQLRDPNYLPPIHKAIPLGIQHVLAMFISNVTPAIIVAGAAGFGFGSNSPDFPSMLYMIQMSMLFAGIATLIQTIGMGPVGAKLPIVQGTSFAFLPVMIPLVAGGGVALVRSKSVLDKVKTENDDEATGLQIVARAIEAPLRTIVENAGGEGSVVVSKVYEGKGDFGYDAKSDGYVEMMKAGIIDPKKVTRVALENAASVSGMILTTECALTDIKEDAPPMPPMGGGGMPGMM